MNQNSATEIFLNKNGEQFLPYYKKLYDKLQAKDFLIDRTGCKIVELIAPRIELDMKDNDGYLDFTARKTPRKYAAQETAWYGSNQTSIKGSGHEDGVDNITTWKNIADLNECVNSNYGYLVYNRGNFSQFSHCLKHLQDQKDSREGIIIYTRPSIQLESNDLGCQDFICAICQHFMIRDNKLMCVTEQRSADCIYGVFNDIYWFISVYKDMFNKLKLTYPDLEEGQMIYIPNSFHCYEKHFELLENLVLGIKK